MIADRIKSLRENQNKTQSELAHIFHVSTDYLLGVNTTSSISVAGLTEIVSRFFSKFNFCRQVAGS